MCARTGGRVAGRGVRGCACGKRERNRGGGEHGGREKLFGAREGVVRCGRERSRRLGRAAGAVTLKNGRGVADAPDCALQLVGEGSLQAVGERGRGGGGWLLLRRGGGRGGRLPHLQGLALACTDTHSWAGCNPLFPASSSQLRRCWGLIEAGWGGVGPCGVRTTIRSSATRVYPASRPV